MGASYWVDSIKFWRSDLRFWIDAAIKRYVPKRDSDAARMRCLRCIKRAQRELRRSLTTECW